MSATTQIASLLLLAMFLIFGIVYGEMAIGSTDQGVNMTGSAYQTQYNASTSTAITTFALLGNTPLIIGIMILVVSVMGIAYMMSGKRR